MNILITTFSFPSFKNGVYDGKFVLSEALAYAANGSNMRVITPHFDGSDKLEKIHERITVIRFRYFFPTSLQVLKKPGHPIYKQKSFLSLLQIPILCFFFIIAILREAAWADLIHAQWTVTALLALPAKWIFRKKMILTARGSDLRLLPTWMNRFVHNQTDAAVDCFGPQPWNNKYKASFPSRYLQLPLIVHDNTSGVMPEDMRSILNEKPDAFVILYIGRFDAIKIKLNKLPLLIILESCALIKKKNLNFHLFYIGDGSSEIKDKMLIGIKKNKLQQYVTLLGPKLNVLEYIQFCHLGVGGIAFNGVSQEFTVSGKPQILIQGVDNEDTPWRHQTNAIFSQPDTNDLADKLLWAINNPELTRQIGKTAKNQMGKYIADTKIGGLAYLNAFQKLLKSNN